MWGGTAGARRYSVGDARLLQRRRLIRVLQCSVWLCWRLAFSAVRRFSSESSVQSFCVSFPATFAISSPPPLSMSPRLPLMCWSVLSFPHVPLLFGQALLAAACSSGAAKGKGPSESSTQPQAQSLHSMRITRIRYTRSTIAIKSTDQSSLSIAVCSHLICLAGFWLSACAPLWDRGSCSRMLQPAPTYHSVNQSAVLQCLMIGCWNKRCPR